MTFGQLDGHSRLTAPPYSPQRFPHFLPQGVMQARAHFSGEFDRLRIAEKLYSHLGLIDNQFAVFTRCQMVLDLPQRGNVHAAIEVIRELPNYVLTVQLAAP